MAWRIRDPVTTELAYRPEITFEQRVMLIEWAVKQKYGGGIKERGTDPDYPGSTYWKLQKPVKITVCPTMQRAWVTHHRKSDQDVAQIILFLQEVLATHPPTRH